VTAVVAEPTRVTVTPGPSLLVGIVLATLTEAIASTVLSLGRSDIIGDTYATPDELAWLDVSFTSLKLIGFISVAWLMTRSNPRNIILASVVAMGLASGLSAITTSLDVLILLRVVQGFAGGCLLVAGQATLFLVYPRNRQPVLQAMFAMGAVVAPATLTPALQGWLLDSQSWTWIFLSILPVAAAASGFLLISDAPVMPMADRRSFDWIAFLLISVSASCFAYVLSQGSRWDWFEAPRLVWLTTCGTAGLLVFLGHQAMRQGKGLIDLGVFRTHDFAFAFIVSFVAGAALFGSAFLIASFCVSVLAFTPTAAGQLLLPSAVPFVGALLIAAFLMQVRRLPPIATVPFGILLTMLAMWMLSGSTIESGDQDMSIALLVRGVGLGFLFLSITLVAFSKLAQQSLSSGIGLFNAGRQLGGLMGVAGLQTLIDHQIVANFEVLRGNLTTGTLAASERLAATSAVLAAKGMDAAEANRAAINLLVRSVMGQSTVIAFDMAFLAVAALFVVAAPVMIVVKLGLGRYARD